MSHDLKPCPFCGYDMEESGLFECISTGIEPITGKKSYKINCPFCDSSSSKQFSQAEAIAIWNRRADCVCSSGTKESGTADLLTASVIQEYQQRRKTLVKGQEFNALGRELRDRFSLTDMEALNLLWNRNVLEILASKESK